MSGSRSYLLITCPEAPGGLSSFGRRQTRRQTSFGETDAETGDTRANMARIRQSRPDAGLGLHENVLKTWMMVPSLLGSGSERTADALS